MKDNKHENAMKQFGDKGCYPPYGNRTIPTTLTGEMLSGSCACANTKDKVKCIPGSGKHITICTLDTRVFNSLHGVVQLTEQTTGGSLPTARKRKEKGVQAANLGD